MPSSVPQVEAFCDVTLAVEGSTLKCHKVILAASSMYFQSIFMENTCKHPIVFLKVKFILFFMWKVFSFFFNSSFIRNNTVSSV